MKKMYCYNCLKEIETILNDDEGNPLCPSCLRKNVKPQIQNLSEMRSTPLQ